MTLHQRTLGRTGAEVTTLGYGAMELRGAPRSPDLSDDEAGRLINAVLDSGINLIDTSIDYGRSERIIGIYVGNRRAEYFLASKCGCIPSDDERRQGPSPHDYTDTNLRIGIKRSLKLLQTDHLDLLQVHISPSIDQMHADGTIETMQALQSEGKVRFLGMSGTLPNLADQIALGVFDVFQIPYSAVQREHEDLIAQAGAAGAGVLIRGGAGRGAASEEKDWAVGPLGMEEGLGQKRWEESNVDEWLGDMSPMEFIIRFTLSHPNMTSTIIGTSSIDHLASNIAICEKGPLPDAMYEEAKRRLAI